MSEFWVSMVCIVCGGLMGFGLTVGFYTIRQQRLDREAARFAEEFGNNYEWKRIDGKMTVGRITVDNTGNPRLQSWEY